MCGGGLVDERSAFPPDFDGFRLACGGRRAGLRVYSWNHVVARGQLGHFLLVDGDRVLVREKWDGRIMLNGIQTVQDAHAGRHHYDTSPSCNGVPLCIVDLCPASLGLVG